MAYVWQETSTSALFSVRGTHKHLVPGNVHHSHEIIVIDDCFSMGFTQINNIFIDLHKPLDLIFINSIVHSNATMAEFSTY